MEDKITTLLRKLQEQTKVGKIKWDYLEDEEMARAITRGGFVGIENTGTYHVIKFWDSDSNGNVVLFSTNTNPLGNSIAKDLFNDVKINHMASNRDDVINKVLLSLG